MERSGGINFLKFVILAKTIFLYKKLVVGMGNWEIVFSENVP